jgi:hypothetical protein
MRDQVVAERHALPCMIVGAIVKLDKQEIVEEDRAATMMGSQNSRSLPWRCAWGTAIGTGAVIGDEAPRAGLAETTGTSPIADVGELAEVRGAPSPSCRGRQVAVPAHRQSP